MTSELIKELKELAARWQTEIDGDPGGVSWMAESEHMQPCVEELLEVVARWEGEERAARKYAWFRFWGGNRAGCYASITAYCWATNPALKGLFALSAILWIKDILTGR